MTPIISAHTVSIFLTLFIAISLLSTRAINPLSARILGANYLLFSVQYLLAILVFTNTWPQAIVIRVLLAMLLGPALYFYFSSVLAPQKLKKEQVFAHLLPIPIAVAVTWYWFGNAMDTLITGSFSGYFSFIVFKYLNRNQTAKSSQATTSNKQALRWLGLLLGVMLVNVFVELGIAYELKSGTLVKESLTLQIGSLIFLCFHVFALILVLTRAPLLEWMHELKELSTPKSKAPQLSNEQLHSIYARWEELVTTRELFLSENSITVSRAAKLLGVPSRQLSQAINTLYGASFSQYLNDKRVEKAKELLHQNANLPITEVYLNAGFGTKSHFHREFSRSTGMTPSEFREIKVKTQIKIL